MLILLCPLLIVMIMIRLIFLMILKIYLSPHDEYNMNNSVCNNIESGFRRVSTLGNNDPTTLEYDQFHEIFDKSGLGEVMTWVNVNPTMLEECQLCMHVDHEENILCDGYYERGKYGCRNFHVAKLPLAMLS